MGLPTTSNQPRRDPATTSRMMAAVRSRDSKAELQLRQALHRRGLRYRLHARDVYGTPDIVIRSRQVAVFVDGDFWHGNAWRLRGLPNLAAMFPTRTEWWVNKITRNIQRDKTVTEHLNSDGWHVIRVWESDVLADPDSCAERVLAEIGRHEA